jgi:hypothetical protein
LRMRACVWRLLVQTCWLLLLLLLLLRIMTVIWTKMIHRN